MLILNLIVTVFLNEYIGTIFFFFSYWGVVSTLLSIFFSIQASKNSKYYQAPAIIFTELSLCYNLMIFPIFWLLLAPVEYSKYPEWNWPDLITKFHLTITHCIPLIACLSNVYLTKNMKFFPEDWKIVFLTGMIYIYANYIGT